MMIRSKERRQKIMRLIDARKLQLERHGLAWRVHGRGVDLTVADLAYIDPWELDRIASEETRQ